MPIFNYCFSNFMCRLNFKERDKTEESLMEQEQMTQAVNRSQKCMYCTRTATRTYVNPVIFFKYDF